MTLPSSFAEPFGDDIGCRVLDIGSYSIRFGYAGEDCPRLITPSYLGYQADSSENEPVNSATVTPNESLANGSANKSQKPSGSYISGLGETINWLPNADVVNPISEGKISDWEAYEACWELVLGDGDHSNSSPFIITSYPWASKKEREMIAELCFEKFQIPALYIGNQATFTGFSFGKPSCLVLDVGAGTTSVTPIYDGRVLDGLQYQTLGGEDITKYILQSLKTKFEYDPVPHYLIQTKQPGLPAGQIPNLTIRPHNVLKDSFTSFMKNRLVQDFKETTCQVCETAYNEEFLKPRPSKSYEFPDGFNSSFSLERYEYGELLFNPQRFIKDAQGNPSTYLPISGLIQKTLEAIPPELRAILCSSFVITGGTTGMQGFSDRIAFDITNQLYQSRPKVTAPSSTAERCYSSWLGASVMGSLGTFQQLMVSSRTYKDVGSKAIHEQFN